MNNKRETPKIIIAWLLIYSHFLAGCVTTSSQNGVIKAGPELSSSYEEKAVDTIPTATKLDVTLMMSGKKSEPAPINKVTRTPRVDQKCHQLDHRNS